jgi:hypothetical protein
MPAAAKKRAIHARTETSRDDWQTPAEVLDRVRAIDGIRLDPCTSKENPVGARRWCSPDAPVGSTLVPRNSGMGFLAYDGLEASWAIDGHISKNAIVFVNPPYGEIRKWAAKIVAEAKRCEIVSLVAARPEANWFRDLAWNSADAVCFWRGRVTFVGAPNPATFPSALVYHGHRARRFEAAFADAGKVIRL